MRHNRNCMIALLAALALLLGVLAGCAGGQSPQQSEPPAAGGEPGFTQPGSGLEETAAPEDGGGEDAPGDVETEDPAPQNGAPEDANPEAGKPEDAQPAGGEPGDTQPAESEPAGTSPEDGNYTAAVKLEGGTGRAGIESPAKLRCENGAFWATIVWSSSNYDYMKVDGVRYELLSSEGNSSFEIPVAAFDQALPVIADTVAMSTPHEVEYTLTFDSSTLTKE